MRIETVRQNQVLQVQTATNETVTRVWNAQLADTWEHEGLPIESLWARDPGANAQDLKCLQVG